MKRTLPILILTLALPAWADMSHSGHAGTQGHAAMANTVLSEGLVKKVDRARGKLTIRHGPLENLDMPAMTMVFRVRDPVLFDRVRPGDNIHFLADRMDGQLTVTRLEVVH